MYREREAGGESVLWRSNERNRDFKGRSSDAIATRPYRRVLSVGARALFMCKYILPYWPCSCSLKFMSSFLKRLYTSGDLVS